MEDTTELIESIVNSTSTMFKKGLEHGKIQAYQEIINFIQSKLKELEKRKEN